MHVHDLVRRDAELLENFLLRDECVFHRIEHPHALADELHKVFIGGNDDNLFALFPRQPRIGGNEVIRLIAFKFEGRNVERERRLTHDGKLRD